MLAHSVQISLFKSKIGQFLADQVEIPDIDAIDSGFGPQGDTCQAVALGMERQACHEALLAREPEGQPWKRGIGKRPEEDLSLR